MSYIVDFDDIDKPELWKAWLNTVRDYEQNVLKGKRYPRNEVKITKQKKEAYNFICHKVGVRTLEFESEKDFVFFMLKWG
jgi:hypothetical protein